VADHDTQLEIADALEWADDEQGRSHPETDWLARAVLALASKLKVMEEREAHFARRLGVADGGQYRADWDGHLEGLVRDRDELAAALRWIAEHDTACCYDPDRQRADVVWLENDDEHTVFTPATDAYEGLRACLAKARANEEEKRRD